MADREWEALRYKGSAASHAKVPQDCGPAQHRCRVDGSHGGILYCPLHKAAPALLDALELLLGCADWESEDIATLNLTQFKASMNQATTAIAQAKGQEAK